MPHPAPAATPPKVSLDLPLCNEPPERVRRTLDALALLDYPDFEVLVVDNNTADPALWEPVAEHCARLGPRFRFFHLGPWPGFKAGALNFALQETAPEAEIIGVLHAGDLVSPHWLAHMALAFADPKLGFAQSPRGCRETDKSPFNRLMFTDYAELSHPGAMTLVRACALRESGGWAEWCTAEDAELELRLTGQGWRSVHASESFGTGLMPDDFSALCRQRFRAAYGAMGILRAHRRALFSPFDRALSLAERRRFLAGWLAWLGDGVGLLFLLAGLAWSVGLILAPLRTAFPIRLFLLPVLGLVAARLAAALVRDRRRPPRGLREQLGARLGAAMAGLALAHTTGKAVLWGLATRRMPHLRTPKHCAASALVRGIAAAREELCLLVLAWAAMTGVAAVHGLATRETALWCLILLALSLPDLAAIAAAILAALPASLTNRRWRPDRAAGRRAPAGP